LRFSLSFDSMRSWTGLCQTFLFAVLALTWGCPAAGTVKQDGILPLNDRAQLIGVEHVVEHVHWARHGGQRSKELLKKF
jgi:hypothetical protein